MAYLGKSVIHSKRLPGPVPLDTLGHIQVDQCSTADQGWKIGSTETVVMMYFLRTLAGHYLEHLKHTLIICYLR